eukprot:jgi/Psemu1/315099/fgenesh1_kg.1868_\
MHGGTSSQLDWNNKPDESKEALQFYHLKATTVPWSIKKKSDSADTTTGEENNADKTTTATATTATATATATASNRKKKKSASSSASEKDGIDVMTAFTLAHMHDWCCRAIGVGVGSIGVADLSLVAAACCCCCSRCRLLSNRRVVANEPIQIDDMIIEQNG